MECLKLACIFIVLCGFCHGANGKKPVIYPREGEIVIEKNNELRIQCYSNEAKPIQFSFPETETLIPRSEYNISKSPNGTHTFLRSHMTPKDAGWYACAEENVHIDNDFRNLNHTHENICWIYVYVQEESAEGFATTYLYDIPKTLIAFAESHVIIPCRPASRTLKVELRQNFQPVLNEHIVSYNPTIGFVVNYADFGAGEAIFQCRILNTRSSIHLKRRSDDYILRLSGPKPKMIPPNREDVVLQEGDELRIDCHGESPVSFMFPNIIQSNSSIQSEYNISKHENGTHTFIRRHVISEDTGWYGCAGEGVQNNIPYYSINNTQKEIDWIYVYVNSSGANTRDLMVYVDEWGDYSFIPCPPTSPELGPSSLSTWRPNVWYSPPSDWIAQEGLVVTARLNSRSTFYCTTDSDYADIAYIMPYESASTYSAISIIEDADRPSGVKLINDTIIRMTGENLSMVCEASLLDVALFLPEWVIPNSVSRDRVQYNWTRADDYLEGRTDIRRKKLVTTISSLRKTDSGEYTCLILCDIHFTERTTVFVAVFDENEERYMKLSKQGGEIRVTGLEGGSAKWLVDLEDFPSAVIKCEGRNFKWYNTVPTTSPPRVVTRYVNGKARYKMFLMESLTYEQRGRYLLYADLGTEGSSTIEVYLSVQGPPKAAIRWLGRYSYRKGSRIEVICDGYRAPFEMTTLSFIDCPKFPSCNDSASVSELLGYRWDDPRNPEKKTSLTVTFDIPMSGILTCEACNGITCSTDMMKILSWASHEPYFTSTNLNKSEAISNLRMNKNSTLTLECYASGNPNPNVTWFKKQFSNLQSVKNISESNQFRFAHDNRQLTIVFFLDGDDGRYMCRAENEYNTTERYIDITVEEKSVPDILRLSLVAVASVLLVVIVISWLIIWKLHIKARENKLMASAFKDGNPNRFNPELDIVDQAHLLPYDQKWEYPRELLTLDKKLGSGAFGVVRKAEAKSIIRGEPLTTVAVKLVRSTATLNYITALTRELKILGYLGRHPNVVNLLGACTRNVPYGELFVIVEFCRFGNLRDYLWRSRDNFVNLIGSRAEKTVTVNDNSEQVDTTYESPDSNDIASGEDSHQTDSTSTTLRDEEDVFGVDSGKAHCLRSKYKGDYADVTMEEVSTRELVYWAWQISRGMEYLGKRKVVHGDLAARNVLLADNNIVKICDFGLSKALYEEAQYRDQGTDPLPVKWMAVESIKDRVFSYQSDIWSFGVVMWELFTLGEAPYVGIRHRDLYQKLIEGFRMEQPQYATSVIYETMLDCWKADPLERRSFTEIGHNLVNLLDEGFRTQYLEMTSTYMEMDAELFGYARKDYLTVPPSAFDASSSSAIREEIEMKNLP